MTDVAQLIIAIFGALMLWTTTVIGAVLWLSSRLRQLEKTIYRELELRRREVDPKFTDLYTRVQRLEYKVFGVTHSGVDLLMSQMNIPPD